MRVSWAKYLYVQVPIGISGPINFFWPQFAATLQPIADRFMNEARAVVNLIGNGVATIAIARWDQALDMEKVRQVIREQRGESSPRITGPVHAADGVEAQS